MNHSVCCTTLLYVQATINEPKVMKIWHCHLSYSYSRCAGTVLFCSVLFCLFGLKDCIAFSFTVKQFKKNTEVGGITIPMPSIIAPHYNANSLQHSTTLQCQCPTTQHHITIPMPYNTAPHYNTNVLQHSTLQYQCTTSERLQSTATLLTEPKTLHTVSYALQTLYCVALLQLLF